MQLPKSLTIITPFSKILALLLFILLPFIGFYLGMKYQQSKNQNLEINISPTPFITASPTYQKTFSVPSVQPTPILTIIQNCTSLDIPKYKLADIGEWGSRISGIPAQFSVDLKGKGENVLVRVYNEKINTDDEYNVQRSLPIIVKVFSGSPNCYQEEFSFSGSGLKRSGNELGTVQVSTNFWDDGQTALLIEPISTGYGSGYSSYLNFLTYKNGRFYIVEGPYLNELSLYKFSGQTGIGTQIIVANAKWEGEESHFEPHRYTFERWDWNGEQYLKTNLGTTQNKYGNEKEPPATIEEIIQKEPKVLTSP